MRRRNNQDSASVQISDTPERLARRGHLFVVADGMGAHAAGELASKIASEQIQHHYFRNIADCQSEALRKAIEQANNEIYQRGQQNPEFYRMGTTGSTLVLSPEGAWVGHVGDSRVYRLRNQVLEQLTFDHSLVWEYAATASGSTAVARIENIPKNVITRSLGPNPDVKVDIEGPFPVQAGDTFLVCSDGLTGLVEDVEIGSLLDSLSPAHACRVLVDLANLRGGPDNITLIIVRAGPEEVTDASIPTRGKQVSGANSIDAASIPLTIVSGVCILAAIIFAIIGPAILAALAALGGIIAGGLTLFGINRAGHEPSGTVAENEVKPDTSSPYRRYACNDPSKLVEKLKLTVKELRDASSEEQWTIDWSEVDRFESESDQAIKSRDLRKAVEMQAEAVIASMDQLREQRRRMGTKSTVEVEAP